MHASAIGFDEFANLLPEALVLVAGDGIVVAANSAAAAYFGRSVDQIVGQRLARFCVDDEAAVADLIKAGSRSNSPLPGKLAIARPDGEVVPSRCASAVYRHRSGDAPALVLLRISRKEAAVHRFVLLAQRIDALTREIAARRRAESALAAVSKRFRVTLSSIADAVIATDAAGRVTFMNEIAERLTGSSLADALGRHLDNVFVTIDPVTRERLEGPASRMREPRDIRGPGNRPLLVSADGSETPIDGSSAQIRVDDGRTDGVVLVFRDIGARQTLERALIDKTERLEEANRRKDLFLSMLAHELRNPLAPLKTGVHLLERKHGASQDISRLAQMMERQIAHMTRLVDDLLDVARLTRGAIELRTRPVSVRDAVEQAIEMSRSSFEARALNLKTLIDPGAATVEGDSTRLVQVFANLLSNAAKFTPGGGTVCVESHTTAHEAVVEVRDNGAGMEQSLVPRIFDLFVQADSSLDRAQGGLGIGLTVVRSIVQLHGGSVEAHSDGPGQGSQFVVRLPLLAETGSAADQGARISAIEKVDARALRLLVVDDNVDAAESLCSVLREWGHDPHAAASAHAALELVPEIRPQAVLLDIGLPGMNGYELSRALRQLPGVAEPLLLVAVTGYGDPNARRQSRQAGCDYHMTKPVDLQALRALLLRHGATSSPRPD